MTEQEFRNIYPPEIIKLMLQRQQEQDNPKNIQPFLDDITASRELGGFTWLFTVEKDNFWVSVLVGLKFNIFYEKYPKKTNFNRILL